MGVEVRGLVVGGVGIVARRGVGRRRRAVRRRREGDDAIVVVFVMWCGGVIAIAGEKERKSLVVVGSRFVPRYLDLHQISLGWNCGMWMKVEYRVLYEQVLPKKREGEGKKGGRFGDP